MSNFKIFSENEAAEQCTTNSGLFRLLTQDDNLEIFESNIHAGKSILFQPYETVDSINVVFLVKGRLLHTNTLSFIQKGSRLEFKNLEETHHMYVMEDSQVLMVRTGKHFNEQVKSMDQLYKIMHAIQEKDHYTEDHCNEVGNLAAQLATYLKYDETTIMNVLYAGKIHDLGKVEIDNEILLKESDLTYSEYDLMKLHPQHGYDMLKETHKTIADIVLQHHERLDGSGYPNGLEADEICIEAQILAVIDSYNAMTTDRPYRKALTSDHALDELRINKGTLYNSKIVDGLCEIVKVIEKMS